MDWNDENVDFIWFVSAVWLLAKQVGVGGGCEEVVRRGWSLRLSSLALLEVTLVSIDVELIDSMPRVHVITKTPLRASDDEEERHQAPESSKVPQH